MSNKDQNPPKQKPTKADKRAEALRANLMKRKQQTRARKDSDDNGEEENH